jgi:hypothetical protein
MWIPTFWNQAGIPVSLGVVMVPMEGVEPTHSFEYQILSLARLPIPPHRPFGAGQYRLAVPDVNKKKI